MRKILVLCAILTISACSGGSSDNGSFWSSLYPSNWFTGGKEEGSPIVPRGGYKNAQDFRPVVGQIVKISFERTSYGIIVTAAASLPNQGYHSVELVPSPEARSDQLVFEFRAWGPREVTTVGSPKQRELVAAIFLSDQTIRGIREITIVGGSNQLSRRP